MDYATIGLKRIREGISDRTPLPFHAWKDFPLYFTVKYPVKNFPAEVGFWTQVFGAEFLSLSEDYAIVQNEDGSTFSFKQRDANAPEEIRIQWFTDELDSVLQSLSERNAAYEIQRNSDIQRFAGLVTPNGVKVEIWSGAEEK